MKVKGQNLEVLCWLIYYSSQCRSMLLQPTPQPLTPRWSWPAAAMLHVRAPTVRSLKSVLNSFTLFRCV
jgi:hypothetical protein